MAPLRFILPLVGANLLIPLAIFIFASGFFPYKPFLPGLAQYEASDVSAGAPFNKVIFMVIDALRSDFVYSEDSGFAFTQSLIRDGSAIPFTAHATSPTITMPRIKAITTGSIPSFLDVILNFAESDTTSTLATQDTWLAQMKAKGTGALVMYGDDTWLKLFPETFDRSDGTSSFFVADFTEVDNNVTRHIPEELENNDWNTMVLHYLGLDHIGHKTGPRGPNMIPKQVEMDGIVQGIYQAIEGYPHLSDTLLVLAGDHGMNDAGNHGGSAPGETSPALVFISPYLKAINSGKLIPAEWKEDFQYYSQVEQSDIVPTLAALLDFPVPRNNLGAIIPEFLPFWTTKKDKLQILLRNAVQVLNIVKATFPSSFAHGIASELPRDCSALATDIDRLSCRWKSISSQWETLKKDPEPQLDQLLASVTKWLSDAQEIMSSAASNYEVKNLIAGLSIAVLAASLAIVAMIPTLTAFFASTIPFLLITISYGTMMFASSYVEEEQHFWYWSSSAWLLVLYLKGASKYLRNSNVVALGSLGVLAALRILRRWNQTGQKWAGEPDIARTYLADHNSLLWILIGATYLWITLSLTHSGFPRLSRFGAGIVSTLLLVTTVAFKIAFIHEDAPEQIRLLSSLPLISSFIALPGTLVLKARIAFWSLGIAAAYTLSSELSQRRKPGFRKQSLLTLGYLLNLFLATQSRATNIPILLLSVFQLSLLRNLKLNLAEITTTTLLLQHASFFAAGGSNAISSIDLSSAYNGVSGYNVAAVGLLTYIGNWVGPIFWTAGATDLLLSVREKKPVFHQHLAFLTFFTAASLAFVMAACTILRTHLFIWTVFSPKYLYSMAWAFGQHLLANIGLGSFLYWLGSR